MAALTAVTPTRAGVVTAAGNVAASDTISKAIIGTKGAVLIIFNGNASDDVMTISDAGSTPAGTAPGTYSATVEDGTAQAFYISPRQVTPSTGVVTVTHSQTTTVTYRLYSL